MMKHHLKKAAMLIFVLILIGCHGNNEVTYWKCSECKKVTRSDAIPNGRVKATYCHCTPATPKGYWQVPYVECSRASKKEYDKYVKSRVAYEDDEVIFFLPNSGDIAEDYQKEKQLEILGHSVEKHEFKRGDK